MASIEFGLAKWCLNGTIQIIFPRNASIGMASIAWKRHCWPRSIGTLCAFPPIGSHSFALNNANDCGAAGVKWAKINYCYVSDVCMSGCAQIQILNFDRVWLSFLVADSNADSIRRCISSPCSPRTSVYLINLLNASNTFDSNSTVCQKCGA